MGFGLPLFSVHAGGQNAYAVWEVQAARARGVARPFLQLTNLTESRYEEIRDAVMSGRTVRGSVELSAARR